MAFAYVERLLHAPDLALAVASGMSTLESSLPLLEQCGFQRLVFEDFYDVFASLVENIVKPDDRGRKLDAKELLAAFQSPEGTPCHKLLFGLVLISLPDSIELNRGVSEIADSKLGLDCPFHISVMLTIFQSAQIRQHSDSFEGFLFHPELGEQMGVRQFCESFVEAVGKEAGEKVNAHMLLSKQACSLLPDHVQMTALSQALQINVNVAYLDGRGANGQVDFVELHNATDTGTVPLILLYRCVHLCSVSYMTDIIF